MVLLKFNSYTTKVIFFFTKRFVESFSKLYYQGSKPDNASTHLHLRLPFSEDLGWSEYIICTVSSAYRKLGPLKDIQINDWLKKS